MHTPKAPQGKHYYSHAWDEASWIQVTAIEYERLVAAFPFQQILSELGSGGDVRLLDIGCGSAIFPRYLEPSLSGELRLRCDLLDISADSLQQAAATLETLPHFEVGARYELAIEDIPTDLPKGAPYDLIWALHSLTTVDQARMPAVFAELRQRLRPGGLLLIYQLTADSAYQALHDFHRQQAAEPPSPYMQFEDSARFLDDLEWGYEVVALRFPHRIPKVDEALLANYLRKVMLDDAIEPLALFAPILEDYAVNDAYEFVQHVNLIVARNDDQ